MTGHDTGEIVIVQHGPGGAYHVPAQDVTDHATAEQLARDLEAADTAGRATTIPIHVVTGDDGTPLYAATADAISAQWKAAERDWRPPTLHALGEDTETEIDPFPALIDGLRRLGQQLPEGMADRVRDGIVSGALTWEPDRRNGPIVPRYMTSTGDPAALYADPAGHGGGEAA